MSPDWVSGTVSWALPGDSESGERVESYPRGQSRGGRGRRAQFRILCVSALGWWAGTLGHASSPIWPASPNVRFVQEAARSGLNGVPRAVAQGWSRSVASTGPWPAPAAAIGIGRLSQPTASLPARPDLAFPQRGEECPQDPWTQLIAPLPGSWPHLCAHTGVAPGGPLLPAPGSLGWAGRAGASRIRTAAAHQPWRQQIASRPPPTASRAGVQEAG